MNKTLITLTLNSMSRDELRAVAQRLNVPRGKDKNNTIANLVNAIEQKTARFTLQFTIRPNTDPNARFSPAIYCKKLRTHKTDKVIVPAPALIPAQKPLSALAA